LWQRDLVVASEQVFPKADWAEVVRADGTAMRARTAGRDPGTNIVALQLESAIEFDRPGPADPALGALVLSLAADDGGAPLVRLGIVRSLGPAWHSRRGGRIDQRVTHVDCRPTRPRSCHLCCLAVEMKATLRAPV